MLTVSPWTSFWDCNYFATLVPWLREWLASPGLRGAVTAVGVVTSLAGFREFISAVDARARARLAARTLNPPTGQ